MKPGDLRRWRDDVHSELNGQLFLYLETIERSLNSKILQGDLVMRFTTEWIRINSTPVEDIYETR